MSQFLRARFVVNVCSTTDRTGVSRCTGWEYHRTDGVSMISSRSAMRDSEGGIIDRGWGGEEGKALIRAAAIQTRSQASACLPSNIGTPQPTHVERPGVIDGGPR